MRINKKAQVQLYILLVEMTEQNLQKLRAAGAIVELQDDRQRIVQARVPVARLEEVSALPFVQSIRLPDYGIPNTGSLTTEGDAILAADEVRSVFGVDGTGVRVGAISDGIAGIFDTGCTICGGVVGGPIETEDLPPQDASENPTTGTRNGTGILTSTTGGLIAQSFRSDNDLEGGAEGTALLEIVHDLAPGAQLYFANFHTSLEFNQAVNFLAANTDVVVDDIGFFGLPYDGSSTVSSNTANALNNDANPIRAYFTSVGNQARKHYQEDFLDSGLDGDINFGLGQPGNVHLFQATANTDDVMARGASSFDSVFLCGTSNPSVCSAVSPGSLDTVIIVLMWDDVFGASGNDYDLFLLEESTVNVVASGAGPQDGNDFPREFITFTNTGTEGFFNIFIQNFSNSTAPVNFDMFILSPNGKVTLGSMGENHNFNTVPSSVPAQSDAGGFPVSVISVGAIDQGDIDIDDIEPFSSNGPTNDARLKPDATAIDGVSITGAGGFSNPFFGTSAAAPHGAGVVALLLQLSPCLLDALQGEVDDTTARQSLRNLVLNNAVDLGVTDSDQEFGFGLIDSLASANQTVPTSNAGPDQTVTGTSTSGASVTLDGTGSLDPNICPLTFDWSGDCGTASGSSKALTVDCPFGVSTMNLTVTNNDVTLSTPDSVEITVTDFDVGVSPASASVSRGQSANYTVNLTPQFGSFDNPVSLSCTGLPASSSCSFSPAALTPGGSQATATLTVSTAAASSSLWPTGNTNKGTLVYASLFAMPGLGLLWLAWVGWVPQKRRRPWLVLTALTFLLALYVSCGGGSVPPPNPGTPSETFTITITGASGSLQRSATASLTVR